MDVLFVVALQKCTQCGAMGATVGCAQQRCSRTYHFACAHKANACLATSRQLFCKDHRGDMQSTTQNDLRVTRQVTRALCTRRAQARPHLRVSVFGRCTSHTRTIRAGPICSCALEVSAVSVLACVLSCSSPGRHWHVYGSLQPWR